MMPTYDIFYEDKWPEQVRPRTYLLGFDMRLPEVFSREDVKVTEEEDGRLIATMSYFGGVRTYYATPRKA